MSNHFLEGRGSPMDLVKKEIDSPEQKYGLLRVCPVNQILEMARSLPTPVDLFFGLIWLGENHVLFADSGIGKTALAIQSAEHIALNGRCVLYVDCELSDKMFQIRYSSDNGDLHHFPDNFYRASIHVDDIQNANYEEEILRNIVNAAEGVKAQVVFIDNLTYLCNGGEKGDVAGYFMKELKAIQIKYNWTLIVLSHTPKRPAFRPITENDMLGSKRFINFIDNAFCIGSSFMDYDIRYIKQVKVRNHEVRYDENNVWVLRLEKDNDALRMNSIGYGREREHLRVRTEEDDKNLTPEILTYSRKGYSIRDISAMVGISRSSVHRILTEHKHELTSMKTNKPNLFNEVENEK